jgi:hypothetical protein
MNLLDVSQGNIIVTRDDGAHGNEVWAIPLRVDAPTSGGAESNVSYYCRVFARGDRSLDYDLNFDSVVDERDLDALVVDMFGVPYGDVNFDGEFNSSDLVIVFQGGRYETGRRASWRDGDWNCDREFNTSDLVKAFTGGGYNRCSIAVDRSDAAFALRSPEAWVV